MHKDFNYFLQCNAILIPIDEEEEFYVKPVAVEHQQNRTRYLNQKRADTFTQRLRAISKFSQNQISSLLPHARDEMIINPVLLFYTNLSQREEIRLHLPK